MTIDGESAIALTLVAVSQPTQTSQLMREIGSGIGTGVRYGLNGIKSAAGLAMNTGRGIVGLLKGVPSAIQGQPVKARATFDTSRVPVLTADSFEDADYADITNILNRSLPSKHVGITSPSNSPDTKTPTQGKTTIYLTNGQNILVYYANGKLAGKIVSADDAIKKFTEITGIKSPKSIQITQSDYYVNINDSAALTFTPAMNALTVTADKSFAGITGQPSAAPNKFYWANIASLYEFLFKQEVKDLAFINLIRKLAKLVGASLNNTLHEALPAWAPKDLAAAAAAAVNEKDKVGGLPVHLRDNIYEAVEYSRDFRVSKRAHDAKKDRYAELMASGSPPEEIKAEIDRDYRDDHIVVRDPVTKLLHERLVVNPYKAMAYREDPLVAFNAPNGAASFADPNGTMADANLQIIRDLIPKEMLSDKEMTIALLESLWFCGQNQLIDSKISCFPANILSQLREYEMNKLQLAQELQSQEVLDTAAWPSVSQIIRMLRANIVGSGPATPSPPTVRLKPRGATDVRTESMIVPLPILRTGSTLPFAIGGGGLRALPPLVLTTS